MFFGDGNFWRLLLFGLVLMAFYVSMVRPPGWPSGWLPGMIAVVVMLAAVAPRLGTLVALGFGVVVALGASKVMDLLMIGDSITHGWEGGGKKYWDKYYAPRNAVNMGFSGDRTQHVLWRLEHGHLERISPKLAVLMIGTNNSNGKDNTAEEIADGIIAICRKLRAECPRMKILILAIFPRGPEPSEQRQKNAKASLLASKIADGKMIHYLDINDKFLTKDGFLSKKVMPDYLHPNEAGYKIWAEAIEPKVAELMGDKPKK